MNKKDPSGKERRRSPRLPIIDSFSLFVVMPKKGIHRLRVHDVSDVGIGFDLDIEGDPTADYPAKIGESFEIQFYINQSLYLPLQVTITRLEVLPSGRRVGADLAERSSKGFKAYSSFLKMLDDVAEVARQD